MNLKERDLKIASLRTAVQAGGIDLDTARNLLTWVIAEDAWRERVDMYTDEPIKFERFDDFITAPAPRGLGSSVADLERLVSGTPVELDLRKVRKRKSGRRPGESNNNSSRKGGTVTGTGRAATLDRLERDGRTDLLARVFAGELSANEAAIQAGHRKRTATVPINTPDAAITALLRRFSRDELQHALETADPET